jgi:hypothetical protein
MMELRRKQYFIIASILLIIIFIYLNKHQTDTKYPTILEKAGPFNPRDANAPKERLETLTNAHIKTFDLRSELEPSELYDPIRCRTSEKILVQTILCIHDLKKDVFVSEYIWRDGVWERKIIGKFEK